jgi:hypothetical protein
MPGEVPALDAVGPALAGTMPAALSVRSKAIDAVLREGVSNGHSAGSISWAGLLNCYFWLDPMKHVTGALFTQVSPFYDERIVALYGAFERGLYAGLA